MMNLRALLKPAAALLVLGAFLPSQALAQQNKVIVRDFSWQVRSTAHFDIHYYEESAPWVPFVSGVLEEAYSKQAAALNPGLSKRIPFFLYASINHMQQSNIVDTGDGVGGVTEPFKDRFMVWADGSQRWLKNVIEHEFAHQMQFSVLIDGFWKSARILKTFIYPLWMMEGIAEQQTGLQDYALEKMYVRDAALGGGLLPLGRLNQFAHLKPHQTTLAYKTGGHAMRFLSDQYGTDKPRRMLELFRTRYDAGSVLTQMIGLDLDAFDKKFREYTELTYLAESAQQGLQEPGFYGEAVTAGEEELPEFNLSPAPSPDGKRVAYLSTRDGHPPGLRIKDLATGKIKVVEALGAGAENVPYGRFTMPLRSLSWSPDGRTLAFSGQRNHTEYLYTYDTASGRTARASVEGFTELRQPAWSPDGARLAFVGMRNGFNDLYEAPAGLLRAGGTLPASALTRLTESEQDEASPAYSPDGGGLVYSCETPGENGPVRALCFLRGAAPAEVRQSGASAYDPVFSGDGKTVYFVSDAGHDLDLWSYEPAAGAFKRLTKSIGGAFTPAVSGDKVYFSAFRRGSMHIHASGPLYFPGSPAEPAAAPPQKTFEIQEATGTGNPYKFKASTDLFFPAFLFSSPGGLFWMNYWQASDMLGNHNLSLYLNHNSGAPYTQIQASYSYARWRMPLLLQFSYLTADGLLDPVGLEYDRRSMRRTVGTAWPFDRYNRLEAFALFQDEEDEYPDFAYKEKSRTRALRYSYVRDTLNGVYLTANRGSRTELTWLTAGERSGGDLKYDVYLGRYLKYFPLSRRAALVNQFTAGRSTGRDRRRFSYGGLGGVRAFRAAADETEKPGVFSNSAELRFPLFRDLDYYMWYMLPDFYFKGIYGKVFADAAYGWDSPSDFNDFGVKKMQSSVGAGVNVHTFILQAFQVVLGLDYSKRTTDGGEVWYFYLGPLF